MKKMLLCLLLLAQIRYSSSVKRTIVPFSFGWRFHYGDDPSASPGDGPGYCNEAFTINLTNIGVCGGMERNPNRFSPKDCRIACCYDSNCLAWQAYPIALGRQCYHYYKDSGSEIDCPALKPGNLSGLQGGRRDRSPSPAFRTDYVFATDSTQDVDRNWTLVDVPHDFISSRANFTNDISNFKQGYLPRNASWYRKHFTLPEEWSRDGGETYVRFEGSFHHSTVFLNGEYVMQHGSGYTPFTVRLDNHTKIRFGKQNSGNVLAIRTDASFGSGHWYEGGGLYRDVTLVHVPKVHVVFDGLFVPTNQSTNDVIAPRVEIEGVSSGVVVQFSLLDDSNTVITSNTSSELNLTSGNTTIFNDLTLISNIINPWSIQTPYLYTIRVDVFSNKIDIDTVEAKVGFRTVAFDGESGMRLNGHDVKLRGIYFLPRNATIFISLKTRSTQHRFLSSQLIRWTWSCDSRQNMVISNTNVFGFGFEFLSNVSQSLQIESVRHVGCHGTNDMGRKSRLWCKIRQRKLCRGNENNGKTPS